jgi:hypothetical protein
MGTPTTRRRRGRTPTQAEPSATRRRYLRTLGTGTAALLTASLASCAPGQAGQAGDGGTSGASGPPINLRFMTRGSDGSEAWFVQKVAEEQFARVTKPAGLKSLPAVLPKAGFPFYKEVPPRVARLVTDVLRRDEELRV